MLRNICTGEEEIERDRHTGMWEDRGRGGRGESEKGRQREGRGKRRREEEKIVA